MYRRRTLETFLKEANKHFPALMITGPRQVGKTTILRHMSEKNRTYISLDDPLLASLARKEPALFLQRFEPPILIDEIQYAPELLPYIKLYVDEHRNNGDFWLTGSQQFHLMKGVSESLAGRVGIMHMQGLSLKEQQNHAEADTPFLPNLKQLQKRIEEADHLSLKELYRIIWRGSFPALDLNPMMNRNLFYSSYVQTYLQRDVRDLARVGDEDAFLKFLRAAAARTAQLLNLSEMARDVGISSVTAKHWLTILQSSGIIYLLEPYHTNITKRLIKTPKLIFLDTGLAAYLTEWSTPETLEAGSMSGNILETFAISEILKSYWHNGREAPLYYYRDKDQREIDLLIVQDNTIYPIECKKTATPSTDAIRHFRALETLRTPIGAGAVLCLSDKLLPISQHVQAVPIYSL